MADDREHGVKLDDALMKVLGAGKHELPAIVEGLNQTDVKPASGTRWTADQFCEELHRRARPPEKKTYSPVAQPRNDQGNGGGEIAWFLPNPANAEERSEYLVRHGLRNQWYIVAASKEVADKPLAITRLDERMVLWRDEQGQVQALADRCPHRGVARRLERSMAGLSPAPITGFKSTAQDASSKCPRWPIVLSKGAASFGAIRSSSTIRRSGPISATRSTRCRRPSSFPKS